MARPAPADAALETLRPPGGQAQGAATSGRSLDETFLDPRRGIEMSLRWVYSVMVQEYARHNGHADLLRESIDGATGH
ncbi:mycothiol transferase [Sphaerisporangium krabiense]|uniref:mycothiol transferase n=1 Tax=Sphaerisporangium krabiense TaxID=763782 RepID=UPI001EF193D8|nr:DUF664 domain-containing protein [Sphaerisporangium krabiense]